MRRYCMLSGEAVNASKSNILFGPKVPPDAKHAILRILGHKDVKAFKYLGVTMRIGKVKVSDYNFILDQIARKIRCWGSRHLSMAGRVTLINSTLAAIPLHAIENSPVPISILNKINSLMNQFLWSGSQDKHSIHYASWNDICTPKAIGGLGIKNIATWRRVIMGKIAARIIDPDGSLLSRILCSKYKGPNLFKRNRNQSKMWKIISLGGGIIDNHSLWMIGDGSKVSTIDNTWIGSLPIAKWPTFVNISAVPALVSSLLDGNFYWLPQSLIRIFGQVMADAILQLPRDNIGNSDRLVWAHTEKPKMISATVYAMECRMPCTSGGEIWSLKTQPKILLNLWRAANNLLPTNSWLLHHRLRDDACCPWGCSDVESNNHIFGDCKFINLVWKECSRFTTFGPFNSFNGLLEAIFEEIKLSRHSAKAKFLAAIVFNVWKARNCMSHGDPYLQPAAIALHVLQDTSQGTWDVHNNQQQYWTPPLLDGSN